MTTNNLLQKLSKVQAELKAPKKQYNDFSNYYYRNCEDITEAAKPLLGKQGLTMIMSDEIVQVGERYYVKATVTVSDDTNGAVGVSAFAREAATKKGMDESQITGAASSYARKYALNGIFAIDDGKDADSADNSGKQQFKRNPDVNWQKYWSEVKKLNKNKEDVLELASSTENKKTTLAEFESWDRDKVKELFELLKEGN